MAATTADRIDIDSEATKRWYVVSARSGFEKNTATALQSNIDLSEYKNAFGRVLVPTQEVVEMRGGKRRQTERKFYPGYIFVEMAMNEDTYQLVKRTPRISGFTGEYEAYKGPWRKPRPLPEADAREMLDRVSSSHGQVSQSIVYEPGELIRIIDGPFKDFSGAVEKVNYEKSRMEVAVTIFGRSTPVELDFSQVEKG